MYSKSVLRDIWFVSSTGQTCPEGRSTNRTRGPMQGPRVDVPYLENSALRLGLSSEFSNHASRLTRIGAKLKLAL